MSLCVGVKKKIPNKATEDADVVIMVRKAGAIILLVSNTPELCLFWESNNKVTGDTKNPYDTRRTAGGSSGGEVRIFYSPFPNHFSISPFSSTEAQNGQPRAEVLNSYSLTILKLRP